MRRRCGGVAIAEAAAIGKQNICRLPNVKPGLERQSGFLGFLVLPKESEYSVLFLAKYSASVYQKYSVEASLFCTFMLDIFSNFTSGTSLYHIGHAMPTRTTF